MVNSMRRQVDGLNFYNFESITCCPSVHRDRGFIGILGLFADPLTGF